MLPISVEKSLDAFCSGSDGFFQYMYFDWPTSVCVTSAQSTRFHFVRDMSPLYVTVLHQNVKICVRITQINKYWPGKFLIIIFIKYR